MIRFYSVNLNFVKIFKKYSFEIIFLKIKKREGLQAKPAQTINRSIYKQFRYLFKP